jgi:serine/threonine protein kinase
MADRTGQQLGNYRLIRLLGHGGFAEVYLGEHIHLNTYAAIKVLHTQLASDELEKFRNEARTIAHMEHPHIVRVLEFGVEGHTPFLVMSYAPNGTLRQRHPRGTPIPITTIIPYVKQVADALQYAHNERLIHRDVKPENMLLGRHNNVLLSDFGIALISQSSQYQQTQDIIGTVAYMAPEQLQGKPRPASDQYSLGAVVYEWVSGSPPFQGGFTEVASQHIFVPPPSLRSKFPGILPGVEEVVLRALAKEPQQRFISVLAFANALEQASSPSASPSFFVLPTVAASSQPQWSSPPTVVQSNQPLQPTINQYSQYAPPTTPSAPQAPSTARKWLPWIVLAVILLLVVSIAAAYFTSTITPNGNTQHITPVTTLTQSTKTTQPTTTTVSHTNVVNISDESQVLNSSQVQSEAEKLPDPINIYTTNTFTGTSADFVQRTISAHLTSKRLIVIAIDTAHRYLAIVSGSSVPLSNSQDNDAVQTFKNAYNSNGGDYTAATIAAIRSLESSLGVASTGQTVQQ